MFVKGPYHNLDEIKYADSKCWFDPGARRWFDSHYGRTVYGGKYFITSEQFHDGTYHAPRKYSIRRANDDGTIDTVGEFNRIETPAIARTMVKNLIRLQHEGMTEDEAILQLMRDEYMTPYEIECAEAKIALAREKQQA